MDQSVGFVSEVNDEQEDSAIYEILLAAIFIAIILLSQLIGTTTVTDESKGVDKDGCPLTSTTLEDLENPGTKFGTLTVHEWETEIHKRFPEGEICTYNSLANTYAALEAGEVDAAMGFLDERQTLAGTHPNLAMILEPFTSVDFGFGVPKTEKGQKIREEKNGDELRLVYELGETGSGSVNLEVTYPGPDINPLEEGQEAESIPLIIARHACKDLCWQYRDGTCEIRGNINY